jgi:putative membrane protein
VLHFPRRQACSVSPDSPIFYLAVGSPLDQAGERFLLSAHMIQHQLLIYPAAILFLLGLPAWLMDRASSLGFRSWPPAPSAPPISCAAIDTGVLSAWHAARSSTTGRCRTSSCT